MKNSGLSRFLLLRKQAHPIKCTCRLTSAALLSSAKILKENGKIAYLNHSIAYEAVKDNELFAISKGIRNFRKLRTPDISLFSSKDKDTLYHLIEQTSLSLSKKEQEVCTILCPFPQILQDAG